MHSLNRIPTGEGWRDEDVDRDKRSDFEARANKAIYERRAPEDPVFDRSPKMFEPPFYSISTVETDAELAHRSAIATDLSKEAAPTPPQTPWALIGILGLALAGMSAFAVSFLGAVLS